jgi:hypothetical protein
MNADGPRDRDQDEGNDKSFIGLFPVIHFNQKINWNKKIQDQIPVEEDNVPGQNGIREVHGTHKREHVPKAIKPAEVRKDKEQGHCDGRGCKKLPEDDDLFNGSKMVDIGRDNKKDRGSRYAYEIREIGNIEAPYDLVPHVCRDEAHLNLLQVGEETHQHDAEKEETPEIIFF